MIIAVINATFVVAKRKPEKNPGLYGIRTLDLCDTGAALYQLIFFFGFLFSTVKVAYIIIIITCLNRMTISVIKTAINMGPVFK